MIWLPHTELLQEIIAILKNSQSLDKVIQKDAALKIQQLNEYPDFNNYLTYILTQLESLDEATRSLSGIVLKNNIRSSSSCMQPETIEYVKHQCLRSIGDPSQLIRSTIAYIISTMASNGGMYNWPQLLAILCDMLDSQSYNVCEGAFRALQMICEDSTEFVYSPIFNRPLSFMIPKLLQFFTHSSPKIRSYAIACISEFTIFLDDFIGDVYNSLTDGKYEMPSECNFMELHMRMNCLSPYMPQIIERMLPRIQDSDEGISLQALKFLRSLAAQGAYAEILEPYLEPVVPMLLIGMRYTETDIMQLQADVENDEMMRDGDDVWPHFHKARTQAMKSLEFDMDCDSEDVETCLDDDDYNEWNKRKCSAAILDTLSCVYGEKFLPKILPTLNEILWHQEWIVKESAILALGAIAKGCNTAMIKHLPEIVPYLIDCLSDKQALVRTISCWTLSRYMFLIVEQPHGEYMKPLVEGMLKCILDTNKSVQVSACSAFVALEEEACMQLVPYLGYILYTLLTALSKYQKKNISMLYDLIGILADSVGTHLSKPHYVEMLMPPLFERWNLTNDNDRNLLPLFGCLSCLAASLRNEFLPYSEPIYFRCVALIQQTINEERAYNAGLTGDFPDKERIAVALELLSGIAEGIGSYVEPLIANSNIMELLREIVKDQKADVLQCAFGLLGDISKACFHHVYRYVPEFLPTLCKHFDPYYLKVSNNAIGAVKEICVNLGEETLQYLHPILKGLLQIIKQPDAPDALLRVAALTIACLGYVCPVELGPYLPELAQRLCIYIKKLHDRDDKDLALRGVCRMITCNPPGITADFIYFCDGITSLSYPSEELYDNVQKVFDGFKEKISADDWREFMNKLPVDLTERLVFKYNIY